jgi:hypothetical protein
MPRCFVIQPFDSGGPYDKRFDDVLSPAIECAGLDPYRVDRDPSVVVPIDEIETGIRNADICLADISTDNPNIWYEVGFAMASKKNVLLICARNRSTPYPFDVQHRNIIRYASDSPRDFEKLKKQIEECLKSQLISGIRANADKGASAIVAAFPDGKPDLLTEELSTAKYLDLLAISFRGLFSLKKNIIRAVRDNGIPVRAMILDPKSAFVAGREVQEGELRRGKIAAECESTIDRALEICTELREKRADDHLKDTQDSYGSFELRLYDTIPYCKLIITDTLVRYTPYLIHERSGFTPCLDCQGSSAITEHLRKHFEMLWSHPSGKTAAIFAIGR